jgi:hypothetical protein
LAPCQRDLFAGAGVNRKNILAGANGNGAGAARQQPRRHKSAVRPNNVNGQAAPRFQAPHGAFGPGGGQGREQVQLSGVALQQHFGNARREAEIAVNLKRRMSIK